MSRATKDYRAPASISYLMQSVILTSGSVDSRGEVATSSCSIPGKDFVRFHLDTCDIILSELFEDIEENDRVVVMIGLRTLTTYLRTKGNEHERP